MKKVKFILLVIISLSHYLSAQIIFQKTFGGTSFDFGYSVHQTTDGGYIVADYTNSFGAGEWDICLIKTDAYGDSLWTKTFGGTETDVGVSIEQTTDGGYIIAGSTWSFGIGNTTLYLIKIDANGDSLWTKTFGGTDLFFGSSVKQTTDGGYIIVGNTDGLNPGSQDVYLLKTDTNGDLLWAKTIGGTNTDVGNSVAQTKDGGYIITGYTYSFGAGNKDVYLIKMDSNGYLDWTKTFGGLYNDLGYSVQQTPDEGYIIAGVTKSFGAGNDDVYLVKTDASGDTIWTKTFGGTNDETGFSVQQTKDGGYIISGFTVSFGTGISDVYLIKTDSNGNSLWTKSFGDMDSEVGNSIEQTTDGGYIIAGFTDSYMQGDFDVYLIKTDSNGNSGCNQSNPPTIVSTTLTQVISPATIVTSKPTIVTSPATIVGVGGTITTLCANVGINETRSRNLFHISPNPASSNFIISFERTIEKGNVELINILGTSINIGISSNINNESKKEISVKNISNGIYFVKVFDGEKYYCKKIILEND